MSLGRRNPRRLGEALQAAVEPLAPDTLLGAVQAAWPAAVGERLAAQATPVSERDGVVTVACASSTWAQELDLLGADVLEKVRSELPESADLQGLRFAAGKADP
jgi:predicted nucleic acid-binding Zn ribbon protein